MSKHIKNKSKDDYESDINIILAPGMEQIPAGERRYCSVQKINCRGQYCMLNTLPREVTNTVYGVYRNINNISDQRFMSSEKNYYIHVDRYKNFWYRHCKRTIDPWQLITMVFTDNSDNMSFRHSKATPWHLSLIHI